MKENSEADLSLCKLPRIFRKIGKIFPILLFCQKPPHQKSACTRDRSGNCCRRVVPLKWRFLSPRFTRKKEKIASFLGIAFLFRAFQPMRIGDLLVAAEKAVAFDFTDALLLPSARGGDTRF
jgi:hypothetical protein